LNVRNDLNTESRYRRGWRPANNPLCSKRRGRLGRRPHLYSVTASEHSALVTTAARKPVGAIADPYRQTRQPRAN